MRLGSSCHPRDSSVPTGAKKRVRALMSKNSGSILAERFDSSAILVPAEDILEAAPDGVLLLDSEGMIRLVNRQTEQLFGYPRSELLGRPATMLIPEGTWWRGG